MMRATIGIASADAYNVGAMFGFGRPKAAASNARDAASSQVGELALLHVDALYNFARYLAPSPADAEDLVQEAFARALGAAHSFEAGTNMKAWLFRILRNAHLDRRRRAPHDPLHLAAKGGSHEQDEEASWEPIDDRARDALAHIEASELYEAVMALEETYRTPLLLDLEGMTESEVAQVLECKVGTVKSRLSRAKEQLRRRLTTERRSKEDRDGQ